MKLPRPVFLLFVFWPIISWSQAWVEGYSYSGTLLDPQKWVLSSSSGNVQYTFLNPGLRLSGGGWSLVDWYFKIPTTTEWSVVQRFKGKDAPGWKNAFVSGNDGQTATTITYEHQTGYGVTNPTWFSSVTSDYVYFTENWDYHWLGLAYNPSSRTLSRVFSLDSDSTIPGAPRFTNLSSSTIAANAHEITLTTGVYFQSGGDDFTFTDFQIVPYSVPEPSSLAFLMASGAVFAAVRRRKSD